MAKRRGREQIVSILREVVASPQPVADLCRRHGISEETFYRCQRIFDEIKESEARQVSQFSAENAHLNKRLAERDQEWDALKRRLENKL
jgi:putative transposase